jgi:hypothetical protein
MTPIERHVDQAFPRSAPAPVSTREDSVFFIVAKESPRRMSTIVAVGSFGGSAHLLVATILKRETPAETEPVSD